MSQRRVPRLLPLLVLLSLVPACGGVEDVTVVTTAAEQATTGTNHVRGTTAASISTSTTEPATVVERPAPGEPWDLTFFGFDDVLSELTAELYAEAVADALGTEVRLARPAGFDHVWAATLLPQLRGDRYPPLGYLVPTAEIIVLLSRPGERNDGSDEYIVEDFERCWWRAAQGEPPASDLPADYWDSYRQDLNGVFAELWDLRQGIPTVLIALDLYNPSLPMQREAGIDGECVAWFESWSDVVADVAGPNGSLVVSLHDLFNGPDHDQDPADPEYVGPTDDDPARPWYRATPAGAARIAQALVEAGLDPMSQPWSSNVAEITVTLDSAVEQVWTGSGR